MTTPGRRVRTLAGAVLAGALLASAFPDLGWWPAAPLGICVLLIALRGGSARWNALLGWVAGSMLLLPVLWWADTSVGPVPWLALSLVEAGFVAAFAAAWTWVRALPALHRWPVLAVLAPAVLWVAAEEARSRWPFGGFPWGRLAFSQADSPLVHLAWLGGAPLVSGAVVLVGTLLERAVDRLSAGQRRRTLATAGAALLVALSGFAIPLGTGAQGGELRTGMVQGNVPGQGLDAFGRQWQVLDNHVAGTTALLDQVTPGELDLVVWPENGSDVDPQVSTQAAAKIDGAATAIGAPMLVGTVQYPSTGGRYNTSVLWEPGTGVVAQYSKQRPAPFAEYIPMRAVARLFSSAVDRVTTDMLPGHLPGYVPLTSPRLGRTVGLGTIICFEVAYDDVVHGAVRAGGEVLVVQTNNATFGHTAESTQQLAMARLRAVETGRAAVQVSTVGVSAVIAPDGAVEQRTALFTAAQMVANLPLRETLTPAVRLGAWPARIVDLVAVVALLSGAARAARTRRTDRIDAPA